MHIKHRKDVSLVQVFEDGTSIWAWLVLEGKELIQLDIGYTEPELLHRLTVGDKNNRCLPLRVTLFNDTLLQHQCYLLIDEFPLRRSISNGLTPTWLSPFDKVNMKVKAWVSQFPKLSFGDSEAIFKLQQVLKAGVPVSFWDFWKLYWPEYIVSSSDMLLIPQSLV